MYLLSASLPPLNSGLLLLACQTRWITKRRRRSVAHQIVQRTALSIYQLLEDFEIKCASEKKSRLAVFSKARKAKKQAAAAAMPTPDNNLSVTTADSRQDAIAQLEGGSRQVSALLGIDQHGRINGTFAGAVERSEGSKKPQQLDQEGFETPDGDDVFDPNGEEVEMNEDGTLHLGLDETGGQSTIGMKVEEARLALGQLLTSNTNVSRSYAFDIDVLTLSAVAEALPCKWMQQCEDVCWARPT